jgi:uncharacterized phage-associated protein
MPINLPTIDAVKLAKYILARSGPMSHLKLQKLLYYVEAWHLAFFEKSIVAEDFKAWMHGPVCVPVWHACKDSSILNGRIKIKNDAAKPKILKAMESLLAPEQRQLIGDVLAVYGDKTSYHLECLTHSEEPWIRARGNTPSDEASSARISKEVMKKYYQSRLGRKK